MTGCDTWGNTSETSGENMAQLCKNNNYVYKATVSSF